jgi:hypothetical protein
MSATDTYIYEGRTYRVLARFDGEDRQAQLAEYLRRTLNVRVLCDQDGAIYVVWVQDRGRLPKVPDTWADGWTSLLDGGIRYPRKRSEPGSEDL